MGKDHAIAHYEETKERKTERRRRPWTASQTSLL